MAATKPPKKKSKEKILDAAGQLLAETGFDGTSIAEVAAAAGVNKALVFYYFNSKAELFEAVLDRYYAAHIEALAGAFQKGTTLKERLHGLVDAYLDFMLANSTYPKLVQQLLSGGKHPTAIIEKNMNALLALVTTALSEVTTEVGHLHARQFFVTFSGIVIGYFTYTPLLGENWGSDPMTESAIATRKAHVHWMVDAVLDKLSAE